MVVQFQILFIIEKTDNFISYHASQVLHFSRPIRSLIAWIDAIPSSSMQTHYETNIFMNICPQNKTNY